MENNVPKENNVALGHDNVLVPTVADVCTPVYLVKDEATARRIAEAGGLVQAVDGWNEVQLVGFASNMKSDSRWQKLVFVASYGDSFRRNAYIRTALKQGGYRCYIYNLLRYAESDESLKTVLGEMQTREGLLRHVLCDCSAYSHKYRREEEKLINLMTRPVSTGFAQMDDVLMGGLEPGLCVIGGVSSLGKTALVQQMADKIAMGGNDVLYFTLEMGETDLQDRSISRLTYELSEVVDQEGRTQRGYGAKCYAEIHQTSRYAGYTKDELDLIAEAEREYDRYNKHLFFIEGNGDVDVSVVRRVVERHIEVMHTRPVVIIDYLQLLAPVNDRYSDKQNMDVSVKKLRVMARDLRVPVIAISSFNRSSYNIKATLSALKESGLIEYSADVVIVLQLQGIGQDGFDPDIAIKAVPRYVEAVFLKTRGARIGKKVRYEYQCAYNYFREMGADEEVSLPGMPDTVGTVAEKNRTEGVYTRKF